ncbi:hypothetical protein T261_1046 [Streptomyces lydicus]|nr:hypothetical protein T261_1046 [Streptomyces lydicus]
MVRCPVRPVGGPWRRSVRRRLRRVLRSTGHGSSCCGRLS